MKSIVFSFCVLLAPVLLNAEEQVPLPLTLTAQDRILVLSPHPDDDILGCAGVIQAAVAQHIPVKVVYLTYGDNYEWAFMAYKKRPVLSPEKMRAMGLLRRQEAIAAEQALGVPEQDLIFLGYPDWGTEHLFMEHWGDQRPAFRSMLTKVTAVPYENAFRAGAPYKGESVLADLKAILLEFKPTQVFVSHPADTHRDHRTYYLFAQVAIWDLADQLKPALYPYLVHFPAWPEPRGLLPQRRLAPPLGFHDLKWAEQDLSPDDAERKRVALSLHRTQMALDHRYLYSFVAANELFSRFEDVQLGGTIQTTEESLQPKELEISPSVSTAPVAEMGWRMIYKEGSNLVFRMGLSKRTLVRHGVRMYAFGYRHDRRFEDMPKLKFHIRGRQVKVYDQGRLLGTTGVLLERDQRSLMLRVPLTLLGDPEKIIGTAWSRSAEEPFDMRIWRVLDLGLRPGL